MITSMKSKRLKKDNNLKIQNLITSTQSRVSNNTKNQLKVEMQEKYFKKSTKNVCVWEREREPFVCGQTMYRMWKKIVNL